MSTALKLRFGAELEVVTGSKANEHMEWHLSARELSKELNDVGVKNHVNEDHSKDAEDYREWSIIQEVTITNQMMQNKWGMELVSPILDFQRPDIWKAHLQGIWWVLDQKFTTSSTVQCSTHIHISPSEGQWTIEQVKLVAKTVLYFERSIDSLLPPARRTNIWCQSNRWNAVLKGQPMSTLFGWIDGATTIPHVAFLMCAYSKDSAYGKSMGYTQDFLHHVFRWNFSPLSKGAKGTIEFRQPPGSSSTADTELWITFAASFIQGAVQYGNNLDSAKPPTLELFKSVILNGAYIAGIADLSLLERLFEGRTQLAPGAYDLRNVAQGDLEKMKTKATEMSITLAKFKKLYGYK
ncbi:putative amidoligase enzyme-domain-containing protein [Clohesyomyces aquaticus]|uniref:Putative amidoligase enzyme-domain-containing protein n=1 Tax=Clohesyomyces aquaticus TaxID=1231657 RepID=A0A1Y1Y437_9PLEO|nr:putative amidoligase enzyme-domain-containing protein [Clohesyomyces aquaticus]